MPSPTRLKICGNTNIEDVRLVGDSGADYCGILVNVGFSERTLTLPQASELAKESTIPTVILLCDPELELVKEVAAVINPLAIQLLGHESPEMVKKMKSEVRCQIWKTVHLPVIPEEASPDDYTRAGIDALLIDSVDTSEGFARLGGTGKLADWKAAAAIVKTASVPVFLAGGINPENVRRAVTEVRPFGIDLCSGVESSRGKKDPEKVRNLVNNLKSTAP
ncbi:MAG: phosphoribosylanthranilate isomerase [Deltaproteobacteria bacterium]|nr:phosphoribosylanthranilate isomerase [Deltaproteobacteria bacterium]